jgi:hypothetical protein
MKALAVAFALTTAAAAAAAVPSDPSQNTQPTSPQQQEAAKGDEKADRLICRRVGSAATGSTLGHRQCLTAEQWRARNRRR